jgi:tRNA(Ile)-lysidine synthase
LCPGFKSLHRHHPLLKRFRAGLKGLPLQDGDRLLVAVSGGGDSVGLLALLLSASPRPAFNLGLVHVHHNLRGAEADRDETAVHDLAASLGLPFVSLRLAGRPPKGESVEQWARQARYAAFEALRCEEGWDWIATAHSLDDQAETVLLRIARGTGLGGLAGILPVAGRVVRPALAFTGEELRAAAAACGLSYLEDGTNRDLRFQRNRIRLKVLPAIESALPGFSVRLAALARIASQAPVAAEVPAVARKEGESVYYSCEALGSVTEGEALEAFRGGLRLCRGNLRGITERHLRALWALRSARPGGRADLPGGWMGLRESRGIRLKRRAGDPEEEP